MDVLLAIDPGAKPGYAIWLNGTLAWCGVQVPAFKGLEFTRVVVEGQDFRRRGKGGKRIAPEGIGVLALRAGAAAAANAARAGLGQFEVLAVKDWKEQLYRGGSGMPKSVFVRRLRMRYALGPGVTDDAVEASGLGEAALRITGRVFEI